MEYAWIFDVYVYTPNNTRMTGIIHKFFNSIMIFFNKIAQFVSV